MADQIPSYSGQLDWVLEGDYSPLAIDSLEFNESARKVRIEMRCEGNRSQDTCAFNRTITALLDGERFPLPYSTLHRIDSVLPQSHKYYGESFRPYGSSRNPAWLNSSVRTIWKLKHLIDPATNEPFCYVAAWWFDEVDDGAPSECFGLLQGNWIDAPAWRTSLLGLDGQVPE